MSSRILNPFVGEEAAALYRRGRPGHHGLAIAAVLGFVGRPSFSNAGVGCGTGLSAAALASIADFTVGLDVAPAMAERATAEAKVACVVAVGERTPFRDGSFDAITVASALHWVDRADFLTECGRLLGRGGWLGIYDHFFIGLQDRADFLEWVKAVYFARYPVPLRGEAFGPDSEAPRAFHPLGDARYEDDTAMTRRELGDYHLSQSNALMGIREGGETSAAARAWLDTELERFIPAAPTAVTGLVGTVSCLKTE